MADSPQIIVSGPDAATIAALRFQSKVTFGMQFVGRDAKPIGPPENVEVRVVNVMRPKPNENSYVIVCFVGPLDTPRVISYNPRTRRGVVR